MDLFFLIIPHYKGTVEGREKEREIEGEQERRENLKYQYFRFVVDGNQNCFDYFLTFYVWFHNTSS